MIKFYSIISSNINQNTIQLKLNKGMQIHDKFHTSLLRLVTKNPLPEQHQSRARPIITKKDGGKMKTR